MVKSRSKVRRQDQDPGCNTHHQNKWMSNANGTNPCDIAQAILGACSEDAPLGHVPDEMSCPGKPSECCCSVVTYALMSACWVCQGGDATNFSSHQPTYGGFLEGCQSYNNESLTSDIMSRVQPLGGVPSWAFITPQSFAAQFWVRDDAKANATTHDPGSVSLPPPPSVPSFSASAMPNTSAATSTMATSSPTLVSSSSKSSTPSGTIAASVLGSALVAFLGFGGLFFWRWRRHRVIRHARGTKVDLTEPEMQQGRAPSRPMASPFPYPFEAVVPRHHPDARHSLEPSRTDEEPTRPSTSARRHTAPAPLSPERVRPMDQLDRDLANLMGAGSSRPEGQGDGQVQYPNIPKTARRRASITTFTPSDYSGSGSSRRAPRISGTDASSAGQGRYYHLPPSAQYLADVARYPENVDPERPWNIRRDNGSS